MCGNKNGKLLFEGRDLLHGMRGRFGVTECGECGLAFTSPRPPAERMGDYYPEDYAPHRSKASDESGLKERMRRGVLCEYMGYPGGVGGVRKAALWPWHVAFRASSKNLFYVPFHGEGRILDVGCGAGRFLWRLAGMGWEVRGLDVSEAAARTARETYGVEVEVGTYAGEHFEAGSFDVATLWNSLEHMSDPLGVLRSTAQVLTQGGVLHLSVPNFASFGARHFGENWFPLDLPRHLNHFTAKTVEKALSAAGFEMLSVRPLRRTSALRRSARYAKTAGDRRLLSKVMRTKAGAETIGTLMKTASRCDLIVVTARKKIQGE